MTHRWGHLQRRNFAKAERTRSSRELQVVLCAALALSGCGREGYTTGTASPEGRAPDDPEGSLLDCGPRSEAQLVAEEGSLNPVLRATLSWNPDRADCAFRAGEAIPKRMEGVLQFASLEGELNIYSVVPWMLRASDDPKDLAHGVSQAVFLNHDDQTIRVQFAHEDGWVVLENVTLLTTEEHR